MNKTSIEWTDFSWSPITGCTRRCPYCYARRLAETRLRERYLANHDVAPGCSFVYPFSPRFWRDRLEQPGTKRTPSRIFVCSMGELFDPYVPDEWIRAVLAVTQIHTQHTFQLLTQRPKRAALFAFPPNVWVGVTVTDDHPSSQAQLINLRRVQSPVHFVSYEPLLSRIEAVPTWLNWLIIGAMTGSKQELYNSWHLYPSHTLSRASGRWTLQPPREWVQHLLDLADAQGIPVFLKDNLGWPTVHRQWPKG